jgi:hypothetical protein
MQYDADDHFCGYCGQELPAAAFHEEKPRTGLMIFSAIGFFFIAILRVVSSLFKAFSGGVGESQARDNLADLEVKFHTNPTRQNAKDLAKARERLAEILSKKG